MPVKGACGRAGWCRPLQDEKTHLEAIFVVSKRGVVNLWGARVWREGVLITYTWFGQRIEDSYRTRLLLFKGGWWLLWCAHSQIMIISGALSLTIVLCLSLFLLFGEKDDGMEHSMLISEEEEEKLFTSSFNFYPETFFRKGGRSSVSSPPPSKTT